MRSRSAIAGEPAAQRPQNWREFWGDADPAQDLLCLDSLHVRPWLLKYTPRHGRCLEAGCGLGKYAFYLRHLGIDIEGLEFEHETVVADNRWAVQHGLEPIVREGNVTSLPYGNTTLAGYISLGVVEHFQEGPHRVLAEAYRVLQPGGIAIVETPAPGFSRRLLALRRLLGAVKRALRRGGPIELGAADDLKDVFRSRTVTRLNGAFWQYEYSPAALSACVARAGFEVLDAQAIDLRYNAFLSGRSRPDRPDDMRLLRILDRLEGTWLERWGALALVIAVRPGSPCRCFLCGERRAECTGKEVPICETCRGSPQAAYYESGCWRPRIAEQHYLSDAPPPQNACSVCGRVAPLDPIFGDAGFRERVCVECLRKPDVNLRLSHESIKSVWRPHRMPRIET